MKACIKASRAIALIVSMVISPALAYAEDARDCSSPFGANAPILYELEVPRRITVKEMEKYLEAMLSAGKRLEYRGCMDEDDYVTPHFVSNEAGQNNPAKFVRFSGNVVNAIASHVEQALALGYATLPFFPDMGHGHVMVSEARFEELTNEPNFTVADALNKVLRGNDFKILYHAGENLEYIGENNKNDERLKFLRANRNIVGEIGGKNKIYTIPGDGVPNTATRIPGMTEIGLFEFAVAKNGCIPFKFRGKQMYLDISTTGATQKP